MLNLQYIGDTEKYPVNFKKISDHVVQVTGSIPIKHSGFTLSRVVEDDWKPDYSGYNTVYREISDGVLFSDDGSVYVALPLPQEPEEPEPHVPTLEEIKASKKEEIRLAYQSVKTAGVDVELSTGKEHFPLSEEDITFLIGKQLELSSGSSELVSYQDSENRCKFYSREDMQLIIQNALQFVSFQTTYRNTLWEWVDECQTKEEVEKITYGCEIPEQYQNVVIKSYLARKEDFNEST